MLVLGIESATPAASAALADEQGILGEILLNVGLTHSEQLLPMIDSLLRLCRRELREITAVAVSAGPGSFTGLRIGMATAKALAQGLSPASLAERGKRVEVIAVPTLEALAWQAADRPEPIAPMLFARREQIYAGLYRWKFSEARAPRQGGRADAPGKPDIPGAAGGESPGTALAGRTRAKKERLPAGAADPGAVLECLNAPQALRPELWAARLVGLGQPVLLLGDGAAMYTDLWRRELGGAAILPPPASGLCRGAFVALAAMSAREAMPSHWTSGEAAGAAPGQAPGTEPDAGLAAFYRTAPIYLRGL